MAKWDVQRDTRDNRIIAIRPEGFKGWGTGDKVKPLAVAVEDLGLTYFDKQAVSLEFGGDGLTKSAKDLAASVAVDSVVAEKPAEVVAKLTIADIDAEIQKRGYKPLSLASVVEAVK